MVVQYLDEIILGGDPNGRDDLRREAISALTQISKFKPTFIMDIPLPAFMAQLPAKSASGWWLLPSSHIPQFSPCAQILEE